MSLQIYMGPMFAGKSSTIIRLVNRYKSIGKKICLATFVGDTRYNDDLYLWNHDALKLPCERWSTLNSHREDEVVVNSEILILDEAQFFPDLKDFVLWAVETMGKHVIVVGLDGDADRKPFGQILECIPLADDVFKLKSFCRKCSDGTEALFSYCMAKKTEQVQVGGAELYMPLCRKCFVTSYRDASSTA